MLFYLDSSENVFVLREITMALNAKATVRWPLLIYQLITSMNYSFNEKRKLFHPFPNLLKVNQEHNID